MNALQKEGIDVSMVNRSRTFPFYWERLRIFAANRFSKKKLWETDIANCGEDITQSQAFKQADVIHLHWINQGFLSLKGIEKILLSGKRIVWTLHDQWPFTSICHHAASCERFQTHCHNCPLLLYPSAHDLSYRVFEEKRRIYALGNITFVGCSRWIADTARKSALAQGHRIVNIPNAIDLSIFRVRPQQEARRQLGLPADKKIVLFTCQKVTNVYKGAHYLEEALKALPEVTAVRVGKGGDYEIHDEHRMALMYAAADVFATPTLQDNLPNTIVEAMSCGTPCVGFRVGGIPEMIHHLKDGYVARFCDAEDLANGIRYVLSHPELSEAAVHYAHETYNERRIAQLYLREYAEGQQTKPDSL